MKRITAFITSMFISTAALAADNPVSCQGASCKITLETRTSGNVKTVAASFLGTGAISLPGQIQAGDGSAASPAYSFATSGNTDDGWYRIGTDDLGLATAGVLRLEVDASGNTAIWKGGLPPTTTTVQDQLFLNNNTGGNNAGGISIGKFEGNNTGLATDVNEELGRLSFGGTTPNGAGADLYSIGATVSGKADANWGLGSAPTRLGISTTASGSVTPTERVRVDSAGWLNSAGPAGITLGSIDTSANAAIYFVAGSASGCTVACGANAPATVNTTAPVALASWNGSTPVGAGAVSNRCLCASIH